MHLFLINKYLLKNLINILIRFLFNFWEMLTGAPGALVKDMKNEVI